MKSKLGCQTKKLKVRIAYKFYSKAKTDNIFIFYWKIYVEFNIDTKVAYWISKLK